MAPTSAPVMQVARKPAISAFHTMPMISVRRSGIKTPMPVTVIPTDPTLAKPHSA